VLDSDFAANGFFYVMYTHSSLINRVSRFTAVGNSAPAASERVVWQNDVSAAIYHQGGGLGFGPDGDLYISVGDNLTPATAQSQTSYSGKILRIRSDGTVPSDNPFYDGAGPNADAIWALGFRNPFRFSFDPPTGRLLVGDVGENTWEEVDFETRKSIRGANFGWPRFEGDHRVQAGPKPHHYEPPIFEYRHGGHGRVITGGLVVRDRRLRSLYRRYLYADFNEGELRSFVPHLHGVHHERKLGIQISGPTSFTEGPAHRVYVAALGEGNVYKLVPK
jgi:Glucose / Sorbosone dehydrogenase